MHTFKNKICPYCQSKIKDDLDMTVCSLCGTPHHKECYEENGGCTTYGCKNNPGTVKSEVNQDAVDVGSLTLSAARVLVSQTILTQCPECKKEIEENSRYCKHCGYNLIDKVYDDEKEEVKEDFNDEFKRRYEEKKKSSRKNFLITAGGIIFLFLFVITLIYFSYTKIFDYYNSDERKIEAVVNDWKDAWEEKNIDSYKSYMLPADYEYYGKDGKSINFNDRMTRIKWTFDNYKYIKLNFSEFKIYKDSTSANDLKVTFKQSYISDKYEESGMKTLRLYKGKETGNEWKIYREIMD